MWQLSDWQTGHAQKRNRGETPNDPKLSESGLLEPFRTQAILVTWAVVPHEGQAGCRRYLHDLLVPELDNDWKTFDDPIPVNPPPF